jgi:hypothetical protein
MIYCCGDRLDCAPAFNDVFGLRLRQTNTRVCAHAGRSFNSALQPILAPQCTERLAYFPSSFIPPKRSHDEGLPKWFAEDERKFMRPVPQVTAAELADARERLRAIDARPIKKVAEAKARKRKRLVAKLTQARQKAEAIAGQEDVPMKAKMREIEKVYAQARAGGKKGKKGKKGGRGEQYKKKGPPLDARMRTDKRGMEAAAKRVKGGKKGGKGKGKGRR